MTMVDIERVRRVQELKMDWKQINGNAQRTDSSQCLWQGLIWWWGCNSTHCLLESFFRSGKSEISAKSYVLPWGCYFVVSSTGCAAWIHRLLDELGHLGCRLYLCWNAHRGARFPWRPWCLRPTWQDISHFGDPHWENLGRYFPLYSFRKIRERHETVLFCLYDKSYFKNDNDEVGITSMVGFCSRCDTISQLQ